MNSKVNILSIADDCIESGQLLMQNNRYTKGCYLAGYAVELYLKAVITNVENRDDLFSEAYYGTNKKTRTTI